MKIKNEIKEWAKSKTKKELVKAITELIEVSIDVENIGFDKFPYCRHSGTPLVDSDEFDQD